MTAAVVLTSIRDCRKLLLGYLANFSRFGRQVAVYLIPDRKTPRQTLPAGVTVLSLAEQEAFLKRVGFPAAEIPMDSDNRRNVGYLKALTDGCDFLVSIDDDNWCPTDEDFIGKHAVVLQDRQDRNDGSCSRTDSRWYNNCRMIGNPKAYPRGFPYFSRRLGTAEMEHATRESFPVRINAGLWTGDPDVDAATWLTAPFRARYPRRNIVLARDTWCPVNSQNTAVARAAVTAYYFVRMDPLGDRFGDIFQGYFAQACTKALGFSVRFGSPAAAHIRNAHDYLKDAQAELPAIRLLEDLLPRLLEWNIDGGDFHSAYAALASYLRELPEPFYRDTARRMILWADACRRIE